MKQPWTPRTEFTKSQVEIGGVCHWSIRQAKRRRERPESKIPNPFINLGVIACFRKKVSNTLQSPYVTELNIFSIYPRIYFLENTQILSVLDIS